MQFSVAAIVSFAALALAAPANPGFVAIPMSRAPTPQREAPLAFAAQDNSFNVEMINHVMSYMVDVKVGGQTVKVQLDTGSSDLWVYSSDSGYCTQDKATCQAQGSYDHTKSSHSKDTGETFYIKYGIGEASGKYYTDDASLGSASVSNFQFGVSVAAGTGNSVFGIGPLSDEAAKTPYHNFPFALKDQGVIKRNVYSMSFGIPGDDQQSEITFGAYNTGRFSGSLKTVPVVSAHHFGIKADHATIGGNQLLEGEVLTLDSGTSLTYLTSNNFYTVLDYVKSQGIDLVSAGKGIYAIDCGSTDKLSMDYTISGKTITVSGKDMTIPATSLDSSDTSGLCILGITESTGELSRINLMGDTFLRAIYSVYDLDKNTVSFAQAAHGNGDNYVTITGDIPN